MCPRGMCPGGGGALSCHCGGDLYLYENVTETFYLGVVVFSSD